MLQIWSRNPRNFQATKPSNSTVRLQLQSRVGTTAVKRALRFTLPPPPEVVFADSPRRTACKRRVVNLKGPKDLYLKPKDIIWLGLSCMCHNRSTAARRCRPYRASSLIRNSALLEPYSRTMPRALWRSWGGQFLMSEVPLKGIKRACARYSGLGTLRPT